MEAVFTALGDAFKRSSVAYILPADDLSNVLAVGLSQLSLLGVAGRSAVVISRVLDASAMKTMLWTVSLRDAAVASPMSS